MFEFAHNFSTKMASFWHDFLAVFLTIIRSNFAVDSVRLQMRQLMSEHFPRERARYRVEVLPINWHGLVHGEVTGLDRYVSPFPVRSSSFLSATGDALIYITADHMLSCLCCRFFCALCMRVMCVHCFSLRMFLIFQSHSTHHSTLHTTCSPNFTGLYTGRPLLRVAGLLRSA